MINGQQTLVVYVEIDASQKPKVVKVLAEKYTAIRKADYLAWRARLEIEMEKVEEK